MKRIGNIWKDVVDKDNGVHAVIAGTEHKRKDRNVQKLLYDAEAVAADPSCWHMVDPKKAEDFVLPIIELLATGTYRHSPPRYRRQFCRNRASSRGKWRDLYIPTLEDHTVHHMVMNASMKAFTRGMHPHCCGSVPGRGIKHILRTVSYWMQEDKTCRYFVKLDIRKFFDSIDKDILKVKLRRKIKDKRVLQLHDMIIDSAGQLENELIGLPEGSRRPKDLATPVGYYTSPWYGNLYLEDLDWFIEQQLYKERRGRRIKYVRHQLRYVDDILLIGTSKKDLEKAVRAIAEYLQKNYDLKIKDCWEIKQIGKHEVIDGRWRLRPGTYWCDIGGYKFCKDGVILRDGIFLETRRLARRMYKQGYYTKHQCDSINARIGWSKHCNSRNFIENEIKPYVDIKRTRRISADVDKVGKRGTDQTASRRGERRYGDRAKRNSEGRGDRGDAGALHMEGVADEPPPV
ncbi:MAG: hypothetical protein IJ061_06595 [Lachnospiraceae bacterium]|nr:hypothetical protein [Lachnospiraceae bacterium]